VLKRRGKSAGNDARLFVACSIHRTPPNISVNPKYFPRKLGHSFGKISPAGLRLPPDSQQHVCSASTFIRGRTPLPSRRSLKTQFYKPAFARVRRQTTGLSGTLAARTK
jgi:hypothetical protein